MLFARDVMRGGNYGAHRSRECERATALGGQIACDLTIVWVRINTNSVIPEVRRARCASNALASLTVRDPGSPR